MLEAENNYLKVQVEKLRREARDQSARMRRIEDALITLGISRDVLQPSQEEVEEKKGETTIIHQQELDAIRALQACVQDCISLEKMDDPVEGEDGNLYDRAQLQQHYDTQRSREIPPTYPLSNRPLLRSPADLKTSDRARHLLTYLSGIVQT